MRCNAVKKTHVFQGISKLPTGSGIYKKYKSLTILLEIDMEKGLIINSNFPEYNELNNSVLDAIIRGKSLENNLEEIIEDINERLNVTSKKTLINALREIYNEYIEVKNNKYV